MKRAQAWLVVAAMAAGSAVALAAPWWAAAGLAGASLVLVRRRRGLLVAFAAFGIGLSALALAIAVPGHPTWDAGPLALGADGALRGVVAGLRLTAVLGCNLALLSWA